MKEHEFKIQEDTVTGEWRVWVKVPFLLFWSTWQSIFTETEWKTKEPCFNSKAHCIRGIEKWKRDHVPDYQRYKTTHHKR